MATSGVTGCDGILEAIGETPLVRLRRFLDVPEVALFAKLEACNPGGSAKDRPARQMIEHALDCGEIEEGTTVIESSSGNMGIGLAQACRYYGLPFICVVDPNAQPQNIQIMKALGAQIEMVQKPLDGSYLSARWHRVRELLRKIKPSFWPNQYANQQNPLAHQLGTIREIDHALSGDFDYLFVATSSTGTIQGCRDYLRQRGRRAKVVAVDAVGSMLFGGTAGTRKIPGLGAGRVPQLAVGQEFDLVQRVRDIDCVIGCRRMAAREAILVGGSAGGVLQTIHTLSSQLAGKTCVAILHDSGTRYLDTVFSDEWVIRETGYLPQEIQEYMNDRPLSLSNATLSQEVAASP
ncbi:Pyridoxal-5'-phosphate-dependent protein beta subunit [Planctomycetales bacterium 10988]|nr:Pyridoxal-5'-phosphate-dependent protein beta subunit [Planctomycetales bacterium 10988]